MADIGPAENAHNIKTIKIDSLIELKKQLGLDGLDTSKEAELKEKISLEFTRAELDGLKNELNTEGVDKLARLKKIVKEKSIISQNTKKEVGDLMKEIGIEKPTPEGMKKAFEYLESNKITGAHRYILINEILNKFVYSNGLLIKQEGRVITNYEITDNKGKVNKEYSDILDNNLTKEDFNQAKIFQISLKEGGIEKKAKEIASKYSISISYKNEKEKQQIKSQILSNSKISQEDQTLLIEYLDGDYDKTDKLAQDYSKQVSNRIASNSKELGKMGINTSKEGMANYARNPDQLIGDVMAGVAKNPIILFSAIGLILGKIFGFDIGGEKGSFIMKLFAIGAGVGIYKATGMGEHIGNVIEGKDGARQVYSDVMNTSGEAISWSWKKLSKLPEAMNAKSKELADRMTMWYFAKDYKYMNSKGIEEDIADSDFADIKAKIKNGTFTGAIKRTDNKPVDGNDIKKISEKINTLESEGITKFGSQANFDKAITGASLSGVMSIVHGDKKTGETKKQAEQTTVPQGKQTTTSQGKPAEKVPTISEKTEKL